MSACFVTQFNMRLSQRRGQITWNDKSTNAKNFLPNIGVIISLPKNSSKPFICLNNVLAIWTYSQILFSNKRPVHRDRWASLQVVSMAGSLSAPCPNAHFGSREQMNRYYPLCSALCLFPPEILKTADSILRFTAPKLIVQSHEVWKTCMNSKTSQESFQLFLSTPNDKQRLKNSVQICQ